MMVGVWLLAALLTKHFVCDFPLQFPRHYLNKGTYGAWGGVEHAYIHAVPTTLILVAFNASATVAGVLGVCEFIAHYHIDWAKMNVNRIYNLKPDNSERFWWLLGFDQLLHHACYIAIALVAAS